MSWHPGSYKGKRRRLLAAALAGLLAAGSLAGCANAREEQTQVKIALVTREDMGYNVARYEKGMEMALAEYDGPYQFAVEVYADTQDYEEAAAQLTQLAEDPSVAAVVTIQDYEVIDAGAQMMEEHGKAFFAVQGYYAETARRGYETFFPFCLDMEHLGYAMGLYAGGMGGKRVGVLRSDTEFERGEAVAFEQGALLSGAQTASSLSESFTQEQFWNELELWENMGVDTVYVPYYSSDWATEILEIIQEQLPEARLLASFTIGGDLTVERLGNLEGLVIPAFYPIDQTEEYQAWAEEYQARYGEAPENEAAQAYDLANLILAQYDGDPATLSKNIRAHAEEAESIAGNILVDLLTGLPEITYDTATVYDYEYLVAQDGKFVHTEGPALE